MLRKTRLKGSTIKCKNMLPMESMFSPLMVLGAYRLGNRIAGTSKMHFSPMVVWAAYSVL